MKLKQYQFKAGQNISMEQFEQAGLVLVFGERLLIEQQQYNSVWKECFPNAQVMFCSTAGEIFDTSVSDDTLSITAIQFEKTTVRTHLSNISNFSCSKEAGKNIVQDLKSELLKHILVFADGQLVNGSELVEGINEDLPQNVSVSGGLAGDDGRFQKTLVGLNENVKEGNLVSIGLYGEHIRVGHGSQGGWDSFGQDRRITRSDANVLYELDGQSALELYKKYLGELASELPGSALLFPLAIKINNDSEYVVRTILSVNEADQSMTFAGNMPAGAYARLMKANFDRLIDAASKAASNSGGIFQDSSPELAILISCVGRKLVLGQRTEEEVESVRDILGAKACITGFYSYGEISPLIKTPGCDLHNQTMTITTFAES